MEDTLHDQLDRYISKLQRLKSEAEGKRPVQAAKRKSDLSAIALKSARTFLVHCAVTRTLRCNFNAMSETSYVAVLTVPANWELDQVKEILDIVFKDDSQALIRVHPTAKRKRGSEFEAAEWLQSRRLIVIAALGSPIHQDLELAMTFSDHVALGDLRHLQALSHLRRCGEITERQAQLIAQQPSDRMEAIFRIGQPAQRAADRLLKESGGREAANEVKTIDITVGFGEAGIWASDLQKDFDDWSSGMLPWSEVDKGCLLFGPPGTGKTRFAAALASACGIHLEATSVSRWQSNRDGALGDMLNAMYKSFAVAKASAPAMLFIDEFDSIGDRNKFPARHVNYSTQVVNALLECLDGVEGHEGVIVLAACNNPDRIDPALLRGGRLEKHIFFPLPDAEARAAILSHYLPSLAQNPVLKEIAARLPEKSGADLERLSREARRAARKERRSINIDDVRAMVEPPPALNDGHQYRIAVHEAGHAIVGYVLKVGTVKRVEIFDNILSFATEMDAHGITVLEHQKVPFDTMTEKRNLICMHLAGAAAEEFLFENRSTISTGTKNSDFAKATLEAIQMVSRHGFGRTPFYLPDSVDIHSHSELWQDGRLEAEVDEILQAEFQHAKEILADLQNALIRFAGRLMKVKRIEGNELEGLWPGAIYRNAT